MDFKVRLYLIFIFFMLVGSFGSVSYFYMQTNVLVEEQNSNYLAVVSKSRVNQVNLLIHDFQDFLKYVSKDRELQEFLYSVKYPDRVFDNFSYDVDYHFIYDDLKEAYSSEFIILDTNGVVLNSTNTDLVGLDWSDTDLFKRANLGGFVYKNENFENESSNYFGISIKTFDKSDSDLLGVLILKMDMKIFEEITLDLTGLGASGDVYMIDLNKRITSAIKFNENITIGAGINTLASNFCVDKYSTNKLEGQNLNPIFGAYDDYRGTKVLGSFSYISALDMCLIAEIDEDQALKDLRRKLVEDLIITMIFVTLFIGVFIQIMNHYLLKGKLK